MFPEALGSKAQFELLPFERLSGIYVKLQKSQTEGKKLDTNQKSLKYNL